MVKRNDLSWGRLPAVEQKIQPFSWRHHNLPDIGCSLLPYGKGRSYGDSCLNEGGLLIQSKGLDKFIAFDQQDGVIRCEAGVTFEEIIRLILPLGWFLPVTPGTKYLTVGGAIANDVHGKNHHIAGTFGCHVTQFELLRTDGQRLLCSPTENDEWFKATIGGLGLTGFITWAEFKLKPIDNPFIRFEDFRFGHVEEFDHYVKDSNGFEYTVGWVDCLATGKRLGRGIFSRANHAEPMTADQAKSPSGRKLTVPFSFPNCALNALTINVFNQLYYRKGFVGKTSGLAYYDPFFYPLDAILHWNRVYGNRGFYQYQCVVPAGENYEIVKQIMCCIADAKVGSPLTVLKEFGDVDSPGMLSFPKPGITFALDFPNKGQTTLQLFSKLDAIVMEAGGRVYPAKDARMPGNAFRSFYPNWEEFARYIDPGFSSSFWRRVTGDVE
jgi:FAD/FMN-containing dehydrogenase